MGNKLRLNSSLIITSILPDTNALFIGPKNFIFYSLSRFRMIFKTMIVIFKKGNSSSLVWARYPVVASHHPPRTHSASFCLQHPSRPTRVPWTPLLAWRNTGLYKKSLFSAWAFVPLEANFLNKFTSVDNVVAKEAVTSYVWSPFLSFCLDFLLSKCFGWWNLRRRLLE